MKVKSDSLLLSSSSTAAKNQQTPPGQVFELLIRCCVLEVWVVECRSAPLECDGTLSTQRRQLPAIDAQLASLAVDTVELPSHRLFFEIPFFGLAPIFFLGYNASFTPFFEIQP